MKINSFNTQNRNIPAFQSRNAEIRLADDIMRRVNQQFPMFSTTKAIKFFNKYQSKCSEKIFDCYMKLESLRELFPIDTSANILNVINYTKKHKLGNCHESAILTTLGATLNGIDNIQLYGLRAYKKYWFGTRKINLDHAIPIAGISPKANLKDYKTFGNKAYSLDPWYGFADYTANSFRRYYIEYKEAIQKKVKINKNVTLGVEPLNPIPPVIKRIVNKLVPELKIQKSDTNKTKELKMIEKKAS